MGLTGFPKQGELAEMLSGGVTEEDRERWDKMKSASDGEIAAGRKGPAHGKNIVNEGLKPGMGFANQVMGSKMQVAQHKESRDNRPIKETTTTYTQREDADPNDFQPGG